MVLLELGQKITNALNKIKKQNTVTEDAIKQFINEFSTALLQADVNFPIVKKIKDNIMQNIK